jgi:hypothetical protein
MHPKERGSNAQDFHPLVFALVTTATATVVTTTVTSDSAMALATR